MAHTPATAPLLTIRSSHVEIVASFPAFIALVLCIGISYVAHFEEATRTHCNVPNILPSVSSSIGGFLPEKCIWQFAMAIVCAPRVLQSVLIYKYYQSRPMLQNSLFRVCNLLKFLLANAELFFLLLLSFVTSTENYPVHEVGFVGFIIFSVLHMTIQLVLQYPLARVNAKANSAFSFKLKLVCLVGHAASFAAAMYCFFRHNDYCEPYMYSQFAFFEYVTIVFNIISHASALLEIGDTFIVFGVLDSAKHL